MEHEFFKEIFAVYGPASIPWIIMGVIAWYLWKERHSTDEVVRPYHEFINSYRELVEMCHEAIRENTKVLERLSILFQERLQKTDQWRRHRDD